MRMLRVEVQAHDGGFCWTYPFRIRWILQAEQAHRAVRYRTAKRHCKYSEISALESEDREEKWK